MSPGSDYDIIEPEEVGGQWKIPSLMHILIRSEVSITISQIGITIFFIFPPHPQGVSRCFRRPDIRRRPQLDPRRHGLRREERGGRRRRFRRY